MRFIGKLLLRLLAIALMLAATGAYVGWKIGAPTSERQQAATQASPQYQNGSFVNVEPAAPNELGLDYLYDQFFGTEQRTPVGTIPVVDFDASVLDARPRPGLRITWLGHATALVEIDGVRVLIDPVFAERASPFSFIGPVRFHPTPLPLAQLRGIDAVIISHDHYDHLDRNAIRHLASEGAMLLVPLGLGELLRSWGVPDELIVEQDWWQENKFAASLAADGRTAEETLWQDGEVKLIATPARHYSNRGLFDVGQSIWLSWTLVGPEHRVFYSGDTGYAKVFAQIGERYGPFDVTLMKIGAYGPGQAWKDVHMPPDESVQVHLDVGGRLLMPFSWATFNLALHRWDEPIHLTIDAAKQANVPLLTPRIGETVDLANSHTNVAWWEDVD